FAASAPNLWEQKAAGRDTWHAAQTPREVWPMALRRNKPHTRPRGVPPPSIIDPWALPRRSLLTQREVATVTRKRESTLEKWRRSKAHGPGWVLVGGWPRCTAGDLCDWLESVTEDKAVAEPTA